MTVAPGHVVSIHGLFGAVMGDPPLFDRIHIGDVNRMATPRALGLVTSTATPFDFTGERSLEIAYGDVGGMAEVQYARRLFRSGQRIYGGDLYVGAGFWTLYDSDLELGGVGPHLDAGLRFDTELGIFELSLANGLGRIPL